jgi:hypothetical protein
MPFKHYRLAKGISDPVRQPVIGVVKANALN